MCCFLFSIETLFCNNNNNNGLAVCKHQILATVLCYWAGHLAIEESSVISTRSRQRDRSGIKNKGPECTSDEWDWFLNSKTEYFPFQTCPFHISVSGFTGSRRIFQPRDEPRENQAEIVENKSTAWNQAWKPSWILSNATSNASTVQYRWRQSFANHFPRLVLS
jgi:hypothetical protein